MMLLWIFGGFFVTLLAYQILFEEDDEQDTFNEGDEE